MRRIPVELKFKILKSSFSFQLYMIARHSNEQSQGGGDGVEVVDNRECTEDEEKWVK